MEYPRIGEVDYRPDENFYSSVFEELLLKSVEKRLQSDVGYGLYLSGGLDSTLVGAMIRHLRPDMSLPSYGIAFSEKDISEAPYQRAAQPFSDTVHHERFLPGERSAHDSGA